ncbi:uncharacterized protein LOC142227312 [Haematobia irritans]|uniref:uncharacterized protein LOC142227312 n=1 Tax=Haematobia irritans TaxID=7368 RepID=UPI003F50B514
MFSSKGLVIFLIGCIFGLMAMVRADTKVLPTTTKLGKDPKCLLPMEPGPCRMRLARFYYNAETDKCEEFIFGGCQGNANAFGFVKTCEDACKNKNTAQMDDVVLTKKQLKPSTLKSLTSDSGITDKPEVTTSKSIGNAEKIIVSTVTTPKPAQKAVVSSVTTPKPAQKAVLSSVITPKPAQKTMVSTATTSKPQVAAKH